ncbi:MAG TPA: hypothetical protein VGO65_13005 [Pseudolysinimonas sp.]|nr:hypothetical protein [Pseudolysinimonas sp.]
MKHVTMADKSLLIGDEAADLLIEYAALLARADSADTVSLNAYGDDGDPVEVTFLLNSGTVLLIESSDSVVTEPENYAGVAYLREHISRIESPPQVQPMEQPPQQQDWEL